MKRGTVAIIGRPNVGKSSFINALTNKKKLAYVGNTPGKTRLINFFKIDDTWMLVDVPGYGYADTSKEEIVEEPQEDDFDDEDDDFDDDTEDDDFDTDEDDVKSSDREYVSIPRDNSKEEAASDYKVNVDVSIDTTGFKADDDTDSEDDVEAEETVNDVEAKDTSVKEAVAKADTEE